MGIKAMAEEMVKEMEPRRRIKLEVIAVYMYHGHQSLPLELQWGLPLMLFPVPRKKKGWRH